MSDKATNTPSFGMLAIAIPAIILGLFFISTNRSTDICTRCEARMKKLSVGFGVYKQETFLNSPKSRGCEHDWNTGLQ